MKNNRASLAALFCVGLLCGVPLAHAEGNTRPYSPYAARDFPTRPLFGDQHVHSSWSADAIGAGTRLTPDDTFRFARGEEVTTSTGQLARLSRPYDWLAVTDHSDSMGIVADVIAGKPELMSDPILKEWHRLMNAGPEQSMKAFMDMINRSTNGTIPKAMTDPKNFVNVWDRFTSIAESYNDPGRFTALIAYEWSSMPGGGDNLHRNVIYRDGKDIATQVLPMTTYVSSNPEDLWEWMEDWTDKTGGKILAIPHNGNLSNGRMFSLRTFNDRKLTAAWAAARAKWEPLYEITQGKGTSEAHPTLSPTDEFAAFEIWDKGNLRVIPKKPGMIETEYARDALKNGLTLEGELGSNPFKFGIVGGTDAHTGISTPGESNFFGKFPSSEPAPERWSEDAFNFGGRVIKGWELGASGMAVVWATENTREAIWDAMKRKETYGTTGSRIVVRFFGGFDFTPDDADSHDPGAIGYAKGVPMGGDLQRGPEGKAPSFLVAAMKDSLSGNLDRIQVIKGWVDAKGKTRENIYDVVWSDADRRKPDADGKLPPVGNTVNADTATWSNTIGDPDLLTVWTDPDFDPSLSAFYYARVIEIPTPRWTTYDAVKFGVKVGPEVPVSIQERAYTSPIWYTP